MGQPGTAEPVKLIAGVLAVTTALLEETRTVLAQEIGAIEAASEPWRWTESTYYEAEMGAVLWRQFLSFDRLVAPEDLTPLKRLTNRLEDRWRNARGRQVNIDPGYLGATKLVLASTKDAAHRIFLGEGIFAEATLRYAEGRWQTYPYSYRDYASPPANGFFSAARARFLAQRRCAREAG
jgi:Domain of unknown function (DUF4416)